MTKDSWVHLGYLYDLFRGHQPRASRTARCNRGTGT
jgi:hypothetical protein